MACTFRASGPVPCMVCASFGSWGGSAVGWAAGPFCVWSGRLVGTGRGCQPAVSVRGWGRGVMPEPKIAQARNWSTKRRYEEAVKKVRLEGWTQAEAAKQYGVDRSHLNKKIKALEEEEKAAADAAAARLA